ncbi:unnamed protein product [Ixodes persulcatus]
MFLTLNMSSNRPIPHVAQRELLAAHCAVSTIWIIWNGPNPTCIRGYVRLRLKEHFLDSDIVTFTYLHFWKITQ